MEKGPRMDLAPSLTKVGSDVVLIFQRYKQLSLKVCSVVIGTLLLLVLHLIKKSHNTNHNNRCKIITTNEIFTVYICLEGNKLHKSPISNVSLRVVSTGKWHYVRQPCSVLVFIVRVRVSTSLGPQFIIRCLLLKLPSETFRPSIKVFEKDHYLDCVLTLTRKYYLTILCRSEI